MPYVLVRSLATEHPPSLCGAVGSHVRMSAHVFEGHRSDSCYRNQRFGFGFVLLIMPPIHSWRTITMIRMKKHVPYLHVSRENLKLEGRLFINYATELFFEMTILTRFGVL